MYVHTGLVFVWGKIPLQGSQVLSAFKKLQEVAVGIYKKNNKKKKPNKLLRNKEPL